MELTEEYLNEKCLPDGVRPKRIIGAKAILLADIENNGGNKLEKGDKVTIFESYRGYGIRGCKNGKIIQITRVAHSQVRFIKD